MLTRPLRRGSGSLNVFGGTRQEGKPNSVNSEHFQPRVLPDDCSTQGPPTEPEDRTDFLSRGEGKLSPGEGKLSRGEGKVRLHSPENRTNAIRRNRIGGDTFSHCPSCFRCWSPTALSARVLLRDNASYFVISVKAKVDKFEIGTVIAAGEESPIK